MYNIRGYFDRGKIFINIGCYIYLLISSIIQEGRKLGKGWGIIILARNEFYLIRVHGNLM